MHIAIITGGSILPPFLENRMREDDWDYVIAADKGLECCYELQLVPDLMIGDFDSVSEKVLNYYESLHVPVQTYPSRKDDTDTELAVRVALSHSPDCITLYGATGSRLDHVLANISLLRLGLENDIPVVMVDVNNRIRLIKDRFHMTKIEQYGKYISFLPLTEFVHGVVLKGFRYPANNVTFAQGNSLGVSNQIEEDEISVSIEDGILIMIESKD